jgi:hypothetical protein
MRTIEDEIIADILDEFDFDKVHKVMEFLDWTWFKDDMQSPAEVPTKGDLRKQARRLMNNCIEHEECSTGTKGFHVRKSTYDGVPYYELQFVVTSWNNYE